MTAADSRAQLLDALVAPVRSGILLTGAGLRQAAAAAGLGYRVGERRYTLRAMLDQDQDPGATLGWLGSHARRQAALHSSQQPIGGHDPRHWARRAARTARSLQRLQTSLAAAD